MTRLLLMGLLACGPEEAPPTCAKGTVQCGRHGCMPAGAECCDEKRGGFCRGQCCAGGCCSKDAICDRLNGACLGDPQ